MKYTTSTRNAGTNHIIVTRTYANGSTCKIEMVYSPTMKTWVCIPE
jgi:hypothetical protein